MAISLRDYQVVAVADLRGGIKRKIQAQVLCAPTGSGKTHMGAALIEGAMQKGKRATFLADREALVFQTARRLHELGIPHGIAMGEHTTRRYERIQVASAQTIEKRGWFTGTDLLIVDECHSLRAQTVDFIKSSGVITVGLTATPFTRGMGNVYQRIVNTGTTNKLLDAGWLAPMRVYCPTAQVSMEGEKLTKGEWTKEAAARGASVITGDIVDEWVRLTTSTFGGPVTTIVFSATVAHGEELARAFGEAGYVFEQISYRDKDADERQQKIARLDRGEICGLISVEALAKGLDVPRIRCVISARKYENSLASHIQQIGRGMRALDGKDFCLLNDHAGNWARFSRETELFWARGHHTLDKGEKGKRAQRGPRTYDDPMCPSCRYAIPREAKACPMCGADRPRRKSDIEVQAGTLAAYHSDRPTGAPVDPWPSICRLAIDRAVKDREKWARIQYRDIMGVWPKWNRPFEPCETADPYVVELVTAAYERWRASKNRRSA